MNNGNGWAWARVRGRGDSLGYAKWRGQNRGFVSGFKFMVVYIVLRWIY